MNLAIQNLKSTSQAGLSINKLLPLKSENKCEDNLSKVLYEKAKSSSKHKLDYIWITDYYSAKSIQYINIILNETKSSRIAILLLENNES